LILKDDVLNKVEPIDIFQKYISEPIKLNKPIKSPLREEKHASFCIYINENGDMAYKDFAGTQGSCFDLVMNMFGLSFFEAVQKVAQDFFIDDNQVKKIYTPIKPSYISKVKKKHSSISEDKIMFQIEERSWAKIDDYYWQEYKICKQTLKEYNVIPISKVTNLIKNYTIDEYECNIIYAYSYGNNRYKFYRPLLDGSKRYFGNTKKEDIFGLQQIKDCVVQPKEIIAICAGQKDVLSLWDNAGIRGVSLNSETSNLTPSQYSDIRSLCNHLVTIYDNDETGRAMSIKLYEDFAIPYIELTNITEYNDIAEYFSQSADYQALHDLIFTCIY
tara:strand:+ start:2594 stop:3586 length:993 start_codon:yes stop_codon:yes gene_type:complete